MSEIDPLFIIKIVCDYFHVPIEDIIIPLRHKEIVMSRQIAIYFIRQYTKLSQTSAGLYFIGQDGPVNHATINHAEKTVRNDMETSSKYKNDVNAIRQILIDRFGPIEMYSEQKQYIVYLESQCSKLKTENNELKDTISTLKGKIYAMKSNKMYVHKKPSMYYSLMEKFGSVAEETL